MEIAHYFTPLSDSNFIEKGFLQSVYLNPQEFPNLESVDIAIFGVNEYRLGNEMETSSSLNLNQLIQHLQSYQPSGFNPRMAYLGTVEAGHAVSDTYFAVSSIIESLLKKNIFPILIGGSHDITLAQFKGYETMEQTVNMVCADARIDLDPTNQDLSARNFIGSIVMHEPNYLFNFSHIGYQSYFTPKHVLDTMDKMFFDYYRLGIFKNALETAEPIIRQADLFSLDCSVIRYSDFNAQATPSPNGFTADEVCQLMRYAGMNDRMSSLGLYGYMSEKDTESVNAQLLAQMIWCFTEGYYSRKQDFPSRSSDDYLRFHVNIEETKQEITFYKSKKTNRWWMEVPYPSSRNTKFERHTLIPCSYKDYEASTNNEVPDRWWQTYQKLM